MKPVNTETSGFRLFNIAYLFTVICLGFLLIVIFAPYILDEEYPRLSRLVISDSATTWTAAHQALQPMGFSKQDYWSGLPFPLRGDLPTPRTEPRSSALQANSLLSMSPEKSHISIYPIFCSLYLSQRRKESCKFRGFSFLGHYPFHCVLINQHLFATSVFCIIVSVMAQGH